MIRDPTERDRVGAILVPGRQSDIEKGRGLFGVLIKHFIKVTHSKKNNRIRVVLFDITVLFQQWRQLGLTHEEVTLSPT